MDWVGAILVINLIGLNTEIDYCSASASVQRKIFKNVNGVEKTRENVNEAIARIESRYEGQNLANGSNQHLRMLLNVVISILSNKIISNSPDASQANAERDFHPILK